MSGIIKPLGTSTSCNSINTSTFSNAVLVRLTCSAALTVAHTITSKTPATFNANASVDSTEDFIALPSHIFREGDALVYTTDAGNTALSGLSNSTTYYATSGNSSGIKLAATAGGDVINITKGLTETGHNLKRTNYTVAITGGQSMILVKNPIDVLTSTDTGTTALLGTSIAYRN